MIPESDRTKFHNLSDNKNFKKILNPPNILHLQNEPPFSARSPYFHCLNWFNVPSLHHFTLHYTTHFFTVWTSEVGTQSRTQEKRNYNFCRLEMVDVTFQYGCHLNQTSTAKRNSSSPTLTRYESGDRRI